MFKKNKFKLLSPICVRFIILCVTLVLFILLIQNPLVFPGAVISFLNQEHHSVTPPKVTSSFIQTTDNKELELWKLSSTTNKPIAIIFHGNGGDVRNFYEYQEYFNSIGITSYNFDYRGYGNSSGWPSEKGLYTG